MLRILKSSVLIASIFIISCQNNQQSSNIINQDPGSQKAEVKEVIHASAYTYLRVEKNNTEEWIAINKANVQKGDIVYYTNGLKMENFTSPELQRTFETVYFVQEISDSPIKPHMPAGITGTEPLKPVLSKLDINIVQPEGCISISELYAKRDAYSGKTVKVRGQVTKVNIAIMERNWVHVQDGSADGENFDLTITTVLEPKVGDILTFTGTLVLNKDFGSGYTYDLLLENASRIEEL